MGRQGHVQIEFRYYKKVRNMLQCQFNHHSKMFEKTNLKNQCKAYSNKTGCMYLSRRIRITYNHPV